MYNGCKKLTAAKHHSIYFKMLNFTWLTDKTGLFLEFSSNEYGNRDEDKAKLSTTKGTTKENVA